MKSPYTGATAPVAFGSNNILYHSGNRNKFSSLSTTGSILWTLTIPIQYSSVAIGCDGTIYVGSTNMFFYALRPSGSIKWSYKTGAAIYASPTIDRNGVIYIGSTDSNLYAFYPSGSIVWSYYMYSSIKSSAAIATDGTMYVGTTAGVMYAMNPNGLSVWTTTVATAIFDLSSPSISVNGTIYIGSVGADKKLYAFNTVGSIIWSYVADLVYSTPTIDTLGNVYVYGISSVIFPFDGTLASLTPSGILNWKYKFTTGSGYYSYSYPSPVVAVDGTVYLSLNNLYAFTNTGSIYWVAFFPYNNPQTPVINSNGIIYTAVTDGVATVGSLLSTMSPSIMPNRGLQIGSPHPKFKCNSQNTVYIL